MYTLLAIGAHPDDIELGCAGALFKSKLDDCEIFLLVMTAGEASGNPEIRRAECARSAKMLGVTELFFGGLKDTQITDGVNTIMVIEKLLNELKPHVILTHSNKDYHQDHRNTGYATLSAGRRCKKILMYETPTTQSNFSPGLFVDITDTIEKKRQVIQLYSSQSDKDWWTPGKTVELAVEGLSKHRGYQVGVKAAEAFEVARWVVGRDDRLLSNNLLRGH